MNSANHRIHVCVNLRKRIVPATGVLFLIIAATTQADEPTAAQLEFFEKKIRPVLVNHCYKCHSATAKRVRGDLLLDTRAGLLKGGESGPAIVPRDAKSSLLLKALRYQEYAMPPSGKLPQRIIEDFAKWINDGAADPRGVVAKTKAPRKIDIAKGRAFWSFKPPKQSPLPIVINKDWPIRRIDWFILSRLEKAGYAPTKTADRRKWIRRVTFDVTGLPPAPNDVETFVRDKSPRAYEKVVDWLLALPQYGERWARMWLDVARYAEDQAHIVGNNKSLFYPNAYLYRDWVINALNNDIPFDRFVKLQLAADMMEPGNTENLAALGFIGLGPKYYRRNSLEVMADEWEDRVDVVGRGLMGLTIACARCHDHKYDPIPTSDYYAMAGVFASTNMYNRPFNAKEPKKKQSPQFAMHIVQDGKPTDLNIFIRGNVKNKGQLVKRHFLQVLSTGAPRKFAKGSGRLELANSIAGKENPLIARVIVNRVWDLNFGRPLVGTPSNFGALGQRPTHPQLLDDLAVRFMENDWSLKWLQREMLLSATYRQSSVADPKIVKADPENQLFGRMKRRRLSIEAWRDALLAVAGRLATNVGGKSIDPQDPNETKRTVYSYVSRLDLNPMLALFDFPDPNTHCAQRVETTSPLQKMFVLNSPYMIRRAEDLSKRLLKEIEGDTVARWEKRIERAYLLLFARQPNAQETQLAELFVRGDVARWHQYCHVLLASNEMQYID